VLGPSEGGLGEQDAPDGFPPSRRNAYTSGANTFFADEVCIELIIDDFCSATDNSSINLFDS